tara:strand:+ start:29 stop:580 length:552 start_codon:yes stop_codon:yes gene_type:complete
MRTNRSFRITYFDASTSKEVGCVEHINLTGETIYTDEWAGINMPESVAKLQDSTEFIWDAEHIPDPKADLGNILKLLRAEVEVVLQRAGITSPPSQEYRLVRLLDEFLDEYDGSVKVMYAADVFGVDNYRDIFNRHGLVELFSCVHTTVRLIENTANLCAINEATLKQNLDVVRNHFRRSVKR